MPPASRGKTGSLRPSGRGLTLFGGAGAVKFGRRGGRGGGSGDIGRRAWLALGALAILLVVALASWSLQLSHGLTGRDAASSIPGTSPGGSSRLSQQGMVGGKGVGDDVSSGSEEEGTGDGDGDGTGEGDEKGDGEDEEDGGASRDWGNDAGLGPGAPGFPLGEDDIHVVFSTDCTNYQAWQAVVLFHSAIVSGHTGPITQLISGCTKEEEERIVARHEVVRHTPKHRLFFSADFTVQNPQTGEPYPYMNKPNAMKLWLDETEIQETIVALIDPDFIFLKPLTTFMSPADTVVRGDGLSLEGLKLENGGWVRKGYPAGQRFGLPNWTHWDRSKICPENSVCATATTSMAKRYYDLIPPYLAHQDDWRELLPVWVDQAPKVYAAYPSLLAEQTAYATAAATLNLRHYRINNYALESEKVDYEMWDAVDQHMDNVCDIGIEPSDEASRGMWEFDRVPYFIHYCHMYRVGQWLFSKRRFRKDRNYDQLQCATPLLEQPPLDVQKNAFKMHPGARYETITPRAAKRNAFVLCAATRFVNSALRHFKGKLCAEGQAILAPAVRIA